MVLRKKYDLRLEEEKVVQGEVYANHPDFDSIQQAIDFASNNGYQIVKVESGDYGSIDITGAIAVVGLTPDPAGQSCPIFDGGTDDHAVDFQSNGGKLKNCGVRTDVGGGSSFNAINIPNGVGHVQVLECEVDQSDADGIYVDGNDVAIQRCVFRANTDGANVRLDTNSSNCIVTNNFRLGNLSDDGSGNVTGNNA